MSVSINGTNGLTFGDGSAQSTGGYTGFRNRIINGDMRIDQRNAGASVTPAGNDYVIDRFQYLGTQSSKATTQQSNTSPFGFAKSLLVTSSSAYSVGTGDFFGIRQKIEGLNIADFGWGAAGAATATLSFFVRSSLTGTFGGSLTNSAGDRSYPFTFTIASANTFEYKTITIAGDTSGTWLTTNGAGIQVVFGLGVGSTFSGTAGAWAGSFYLSATGATSVVGTSGATFYITGVQLEKGSVATPFENRPYGMEMSLCQRYYQTFGAFSLFAARTNSTTSCLFGVPLSVPLRTSPTVSNGTLRVFSSGAVQDSSSAATVNFFAANSPMVSLVIGGYSGLTDDRIHNIGIQVGTLNLSSEL